MEEVIVNLPSDSYPIFIGNGILNELGKILIKNNLKGKCAIVTNPTIKKLYGKQVCQNLKSSGFETIILEVPDSETSKSFKQAENLLSKLVDNKYDRQSIIIALGGGVIGDLAGFVASTYLRGVTLVQIPTTLLAQVDSSIGGKVAIDLPQGKNLVGSFYHPKLVITDVRTLQTLTKRQIKSGLAEIIKYSIICDPVLFKTLEENIEKIIKIDLAILEKIIIKCSKIKVKIVQKDEKEQDKRRILNLGHTLGHSLEALTNYKKYNHGEAVSIGLIYASKLSKKLNYIDEKNYERILTLLNSFGLPIKIQDDLEIDNLLKSIQYDKKVKNGKNFFILPIKIGKVKITNQIPKNILNSELRGMLQ